MREMRTIYFSGDVQGVGFRYTAANLARRYDVTGYVRNLSDGRVELVVEAEPAEVDRFLQSLRREMAGYIRREEQQIAPARGQFSSFRIAF